MADLPSVISIGSLTADQGTLFTGTVTIESAGRSVRIIGDINGDGLADILIGAYRNSVGGSEAGAAYVVFGKDGGFDAASFSLDSLDGTNGFRITGLADDRIGDAVSGLVDFNGDGYNDLIIDSRGGYGDGRGQAFVVFGGPSFAASVSVSSLNGENGFVLIGPASGWQMGWDVSSAGDLNGDGIGDLAMSSIHADSGRGLTYVLFGHDDEFAPFADIEIANAVQGVFILGETAGDSAGFSVASAGDVNADGFDDLIIGAAGRDTHDGAAYIVFGRDGQASPFDQPINLADLSVTGQGLRISGLAGSDGNFGRSVASAGDVNGDGVTDVIIGASLDGMAYVVFGGAQLTANFNIADLTPTQGFSLTYAPGRHFGASVSSAGDINGDGFDDIIIGAYTNTVGGVSNVGSAFVVLGRADFGAGLDVATAAGVTRIDGSTATWLGRRVSGGGDVNGDGSADLIVGIPYYGPFVAGAAALIYGPPNPISYTGTAGDDTRSGGALGDTLSGGGGQDILNGLAGDDILNGGAGADAMAGGTGNDTYHVDDAGDTTDETGGDGIDSVLSTVTWTLQAGFEHLTLQGSADIDGTGNALANILTGNDGDNALDGGDANDQLFGGLGADDLLGGAGHDLLDGGAGADEMNGGAGDDIYVVNDLGDAVSELGGSGSDRVRATVSFTLGDDIENLQLTGTGNIGGTGNGLANQMDGNSGANLLSGGGGNDIVRGGAGADILSGGDGADQLIGGEDNDELYGGADNDRLDGGAGADIAYAGTGVDIIEGGGGADILYGEEGADQLSGGDENDILDGGADNDTLNGGAGADHLFGGTGDDTYIIDSGLDLVIEDLGEGTDTIRASASYTLGNNVERLILEGQADLNGTGNGLANLLTGNGGANILDGAAGADILNGGLGADTLIGGTGADILSGGGGADSFAVRQESVFTSSNPQGRTIETDTISDYAVGVDRIDLSAIDAVGGGTDDAFTLVGAFDGQAGRMTLSFASGITTLCLDVDGDRSADYRLKINGDVRADVGNWVL